jgi:hypothetical protein
MAGNNEDRDKNRRLGVEVRGLSGTSRYSMAGRSGVRVTPYVIRIIHVEEMRSTSFPV